MIPGWMLWNGGHKTHWVTGLFILPQPDGVYLVIDPSPYRVVSRHGSEAEAIEAMGSCEGVRCEPVHR